MPDEESVACVPGVCYSVSLLFLSDMYLGNVISRMLLYIESMKNNDDAAERPGRVGDSTRRGYLKREECGSDASRLPSLRT